MYRFFSSTGAVQSYHLGISLIIVVHHHTHCKMPTIVWDGPELKPYYGNRVFRSVEYVTELVHGRRRDKHAAEILKLYHWVFGIKEQICAILCRLVLNYYVQQILVFVIVWC